MNKILNLLFLLVFITSCSFHKNSKFWNKEKIIIEQNTIDKKISENEKIINLELNANLKIKLTKNSINNSFINNLSILDLLFNEGPNAKSYIQIQALTF